VHKFANACVGCENNFLSVLPLLLIPLVASVRVNVCFSEAFVVCQNYSPPEGYIPNMFNPLLNNHSGTVCFDKYYSYIKTN